ncbi:hypothetical protein GCM10011363_45020 [Marivita lacus]|uniref:DUF218 domain-containing protein n=1 Tax=Marivita lacus TaxID=1323742 RepID=A0ABQ1LEM4_9RHOB|nr:YdcF family protein [Marivita lacus]GGC23533.1 hypothetical protein GCM10011363_45020 [Marivita lacus]
MLTPESWLVVLLLLALLASRADNRIWGRRFLLAALVFTLVIGTLPLGALLLRPLETQFQPNPAVSDPAGILILGGGEDGSAMLATGLAGVNEAGDRFLAGIALARTYPEAGVVFTGGSGKLLGHGVPGADLAEQILAEAGVNSDRILLENRSRNTAENAANTRVLVSDDITGPWLLVTSAFHMPRAVGTFCAAGWRNIIPYPVDYRGIGSLEIGWDLGGRLSVLNIAVKEWIGLMAYRVTGRSTQLFVAAC